MSNMVFVRLRLTNRGLSEWYETAVRWSQATTLAICSDTEASNMAEFETRHCDDYCANKILFAQKYAPNFAQIKFYLRENVYQALRR